MSVGKASLSALDLQLESELEHYLQQHPDFFERHLGLLAELRVPHPVRPAISLIERKLALLSERNQRLEQHLRELVQVARENDALNQRLQQFTVALLEAENLEALLSSVPMILRDHFAAEASALRLAATPKPKRLQREREFVSASEWSQHAHLMRDGRPYCANLTSIEVEWLFSDYQSNIASVALIPLQGADWQGLLAIGSSDAQRFQPGMGGLFLSRLSEQLCQALARYLRPL